VTPVDDAPVNGLPAGAQSTNEDTAKKFSSGNGNALSVADVDAGSGILEVTLSAANGTLTLVNPTGVTFLVGSGTADASVKFEGTLANLNATLANGVTFTPTANFAGGGSITITTNDRGN